MLVRVFPTVLGVAGSVDSEARRVMAAILAAGATAFASHRTAAAMHESPLPIVTDAPIEVTVVLERRPRVSGVRVHRSGLLVERDITAIDGVPVSTVERMIVDLSSRLTVATLGRVLDDAVSRRTTTLGRVQWCASRLPRAPGRSPKTLDEVLAPRLAQLVARESRLEDFVYEAIGRFALPLPRCQVPIAVDGANYRLDMAYQRERIAIEADGFEYHGGRSAFDRDRARSNALALAGYTTLRFTSVFTDWQIATTVARALRLGPPQRPPRELTFAAWAGGLDANGAVAAV
jgi:hypothetical protein